jgi:plasmid stabilization system protein ParE
VSLGQFILTEQAAADLDEIWEYIAESNLDAADRVIERLYEAMQKLADRPGRGRTRPELADSIHRFWVENPYLIVYRADTDPLQVIPIPFG